jgi:hypothetical protein
MGHVLDHLDDGEDSSITDAVITEEGAINGGTEVTA